jgi:hypothetical protein
VAEKIKDDLKGDKREKRDVFGNPAPSQRAATPTRSRPAEEEEYFDFQ